MKDEYGHKWSQSTVWSVEKGTRPLRLVEAQSLAEIFGVPVVGLLRVEVHADFLSNVTRWASDQMKAEVALSDAVDKVLNAQDVVRGLLEHELPKFASELSKQDRDWLAREWDLLGPDRVWTALRSGVLQWIQRWDEESQHRMLAEDGLDSIVRERTGLERPDYD